MTALASRAGLVSHASMSSLPAGRSTHSTGKVGSGGGGDQPLKSGPWQPSLCGAVLLLATDPGTNTLLVRRVGEPGPLTLLPTSHVAHMHAQALRHIAQPCQTTHLLEWEGHLGCYNGLKCSIFGSAP